MNPNLENLGTSELMRLCGEDKASWLWGEFLRRITPKIKAFIRRCASPALYSPAFNETDLIQNTVMRLVDNDCAAIKRFSGTTDAELMAYLAVVTRSVVRDWERRLTAQKRPSSFGPVDDISKLPAEAQSPDREILRREIAKVSERVLTGIWGQVSHRDQTIFKLFFYEDLSTGQIAQCEGISLSKTGVEKVLNRLKEVVRAVASGDPPEAAIQ